MKFRILSILLILFIGIQFIPYGKDHQNPNVISEPNWDSNRTKELFDRVCLDCHSHETNWPWYSKIAPVSWLNQHDVDEGREHFNVSAWGVQKRNEGDEAAEEVIEGEMPPWFYFIPRPGSKLTETEKEELVKGLTATFGKHK